MNKCTVAKTPATRVIRSPAISREPLPDLIEPVYLTRMALFLAADDSAMFSANSYMVEAGSIQHALAVSACTSATVSNA